MVLSEAGVSRQHAKIVEQDGRYFVEDLGSANGTRLNGARFERRAELKSGDTISIGPVVIQFVASQATQLISVEELERRRQERDRARSRDEERTAALASVGELAAMKGAPEVTDPRAAPPPPRSAPPRPAATSRPPSSPAAVAPGNTGSRPALAATATANVAKVASPPRAPPPAELETMKAVPVVAAPTAAPKADATRMVAAPSASERSRVVPARAEERSRAGARPDSGRAAAAVERRAPPAADAPGEPPQAASGAGEDSTAQDGRLSAVEKARLRRQYGDSLGGQLQFAWAQMTSRERRIASGVVVGVLVTILVPTYLVLRTEAADVKVVTEASELTQVPTEGVFGYGEGVDFERRDMKAFKFSFVTPTRAVAVLRYMASDVSTEEVSISVNGADAGFVPADTADSQNRELMSVLPLSILKRNEVNEIIFDNVRNPPGSDPWRIWNVSIEVIPLPEMSQRDLLAAAQEAVARAKEYYERREVGSENRFRAWKGYRHAWITLEALGEKPELYDIVRYQLEAIGKELDQQCGKMILDAERAVMLKHRKKARQALEEITRHFPTPEHRCHNLSKYKIQQHELYDF